MKSLFWIVSIAVLKASLAIGAPEAIAEADPRLLGCYRLSL